MAVGIPRVKQTWTDNVSDASAARMNDLEEGIFDVSYAPCVRVTRSASKSIANSTDTAIDFDTERFDQAANAASTHHDNATNNTRLTAVYAGVYMIGVTIEWAANATGLRQIRIRHQGATFIDGDLRAATNITDRQGVRTLWPLAVGEYVEALAFQTSGGALNVNLTAAISPEFWMVRVG